MKEVKHQAPGRCQGTNCGAVAGEDHSPECILEAAESQGWSNSPEAEAARAAIEADRAQRVPDGWLLIATDAYEAGFGKGEQAYKTGREVDNPWGDEPGRGAWAIGYAIGKERAALASTPEQPAQQELPRPVEREPMVDPCPGCTKGHVCRTPKCGRLALPVDHPLRCTTPGIRE